MPVRRQHLRDIERAALLGLLLATCAIPSAAATLTRGDLIMADRSADPSHYHDARGALYILPSALGAVPEALASPDGFSDPAGVAIRSDGKILVVDANADPAAYGGARGAVFLVDPTHPLPGAVELFAASRSWDNPTDILEERTGDLLVLDTDADPLRLGNRPGALFRVDRITRGVTTLAPSIFFWEPRSMVYDTDGRVLIWDQRADPSQLGGSPGALFRVNPENGFLQLVFSVRGIFTSPNAVAVAKSGDYLILDRDANPAGYEGAPGAIFRVGRTDLSVEPIFTSPEFVEPYDLAVDPSGEVWVLDRRAYQDDVTRTGALFRCNLETGEITKRVYLRISSSTLSGLTQFAGTPFETSTVQWDDLTGQPLQPTDRVRVRALLRNSGLDRQEALFQHSLSPLWDYRVGSDSGGTGTLSYDAAIRALRWTGNMEPSSEAELSYEIRLRDTVTEGTIARETFRISAVGASSETPISLGRLVRRRATPGRILWVDYEVTSGRNQGVVYERREGQDRPVRVFGGPPLVLPEDLTFLPDGRILVLDRLSYPRGPGHPQGGIYRIDPLSARVDTLVAFEDYPSLRVPAGIAAGTPNQLLIVDREANPQGYQGNPGALFALDLTTMELRLIAASSLFSEPVDAILESTGKILVVDADANPFGELHAGCLFEVEPATAVVRPLPHAPYTFVDPIGLVEGPGRKIYVADASADPLRLNRNTGAIFLVDRAHASSVSLFSADSAYVDPMDIVSTADSSLVVTDRDANPFHLPSGDYGALFIIPPEGGGPSVYSASSLQRGPQGVALFEGGDLRGTAMLLSDLNGPPVLAGDTLRFQVAIDNAGPLTVPDAMANVILSPHLSLLGASGSPDLVLDHELPGVNWIGEVVPGQPVRLTVDSRVESEGLEYGDRVYNLLYLSDPGGGIQDSAGFETVARLAMSDLVLVDSNADPLGIGSFRGALYYVRSTRASTGVLVPSDPNWLDPTALERYDGDHYLLADGMGAAPGRINLVDYLRSTTTTFIGDDRLGSPSDLFWTGSGDLVVVDPLALPDGPGIPAPVVFVRRAGQSDLTVLSRSPLLSQPSQVTEDESGRLWLIDRTADPNGSEEGQGAIFQLDPVTGAVLDTLQFPQFRSPTGITTGVREGLFVTDMVAPGSAGGVGAVFRVDPEQRSIEVLVTDARFRQPRNSAFSPNGDLWIADRQAHDTTLPGRPYIMFRYAYDTRQVEAVPMPTTCVTPAEFFALPSPCPRFFDYGFQDVNGPPLTPGDEILVHARIGNVGSEPTVSAAYQDSIPLWLVLDPNSIQFDTGNVQTIQGTNVLIWTADLAPHSSHEITYSTTLRPDTPEGLLLSIRSRLRTTEGVHLVRSVASRLPVIFDAGYLYIADGEADPYGFGAGQGALWKISLATAQMTAMGSGPGLRQPISTVSLPASGPEVFVVDATANPMGYADGSGAIWRWNPESADFSLAVSDSTFRSPRKAVAISDHEVLLLDTQADPFHYWPLIGHGAIYHVDIRSKTVQPYFSDSLFDAPRDILLDGRGGLYVIDAEADPGNYGFRGGAVFRLDLLQKKLSLFSASADFRGPVAGAVGSDGLLYLLDRDLQPLADNPQRGGIFRIDGMGNAELIATPSRFRRPSYIAFAEGGAILVCDETADPSALGGQHGAIFRQPQPGGDFEVFLASRRTVSPGGFFLREGFTPIALTGLEASAVEDGIKVSWQVPEARFEGFVCLRAEGSDPEPEDYRLLNQESPVPGEGPWEYVDTDLDAGGQYAYKIGAILPGGRLEMYGPVVAIASLVRPFALFPAAPNPSNGTTTLSFRVPRAGRAEMKIYDLGGRVIRTLLNGPVRPGRQSILWDGRDDSAHRVASGVYFLRLHWKDKPGGDRTATGRIVLLR